MENNDSNRIMARQFAQTRELTLDELKLIAGGSGTSDNGLTNDYGPTQESSCGSSDDDPCDLDWISPD